jgi:hypothetical protein
VSGRVDSRHPKLTQQQELAIARERGEDGVIAIQGALILSQGLNDPSPFGRVMQQLPQTLCHDLPKQKTRAKKAE